MSQPARKDRGFIIKKSLTCGTRYEETGKSEAGERMIDVDVGCLGCRLRVGSNT